MLVPIVLFGAAAGTTTRRTCARPLATTTTLTIGTTTLASAVRAHEDVGERLPEQTGFLSAMRTWWQKEHDRRCASSEEQLPLRTLTGASLPAAFLTNKRRVFAGIPQ